MPFKSKAQRRKFAQLLVEGEITPETYEEWNRETGGKELPERVHPQKSAKPTRTWMPRPPRIWRGADPRSPRYLRTA